MSRFYQPKPSPPKSNPTDAGSPDKKVIRFVLKSGAVLELVEDTVEDLVGGWAERICNAVAGRKADGTKALIPVAEIAYMEEA